MRLEQPWLCDSTTTIAERELPVTHPLGGKEGGNCRIIRYNTRMNSRDVQNLPLVQPLTPREQEILILIGDQLTNRQIGEELTIALSTVKWYVRQIYGKLGVENRAQAVARARHLGLLSEAEQQSGTRHNLPEARTPFIGREQELSTLAKLLADPQVRMITIVGPGGIGKTRLALEAARNALTAAEPGDGEQQVPAFPDGIFFVPLASLDSAAEIVATLAAALGFQFQDRGQSAQTESQQILDYLHQQQMLLVLDNFEHILDGRVLLTKIGEGAAKIKLLVTSRERLLLRGEQLFPLHGLEIAQTEIPADEAVVSSAAAHLFLNICKRSDPDFNLLKGEAENLLHICRLVEGMPLGLELAASWAGLLPLSEIGAEIEQSLQMLTSEHHDVAPRHRSMQAALDVSWRRLTSEQKRAFQELTVFRGGFTRSGAVAVAGATLPILITLVNKSWISYDREKDRYHIHELLRQYGAGKLSANGVYEQEVREKHSVYFCGYLQKREADWLGARQKETAAEVRAEIDNVQVAWRWAARQGDGDLLAQGLNSLCRFYLWQARLADGQQACQLAGDGLSRSLQESPVDDATRLAIYSQILAWESEFVSGVEQKEEVLARSQSMLDRVAQTGRDTTREQAFIYLKKAHSAGFRDLKEALRLAGLALILFQKLDDRWGEAESLGLQGDCYLNLGNYDQAKDHLRDNLEIRRQLDDTDGIANTTLKLGMVARHQGGFAEAEVLFGQSLKFFRQLGNRRGEIMSMSLLSYTLIFDGRFLIAQETAKQVLEMEQGLGQFVDSGRLFQLAMADFHLGRYAEAKAIAAESLEIARQEGFLTQQSWALMTLGNIALAEGDFEGANCYLSQGIVLAEEVQHIYQFVLQANLSYVARAQGDRELAHAYLITALRSTADARSITPMMHCLPAAALLAADSKNSEKAVELYSMAQQYGYISNSRWFEEIACRELESVRASLPPDVTAAAEARGRELGLWKTADSLLLELSSS